MLIEQLINFEKVRTENLKFRAYLRNRVIDGWSVTQSMIVYKSRLLKNLQIGNRSSESSGHYIAFKHCISFAIDLAANFGCN